MSEVHTADQIGQSIADTADSGYFFRIQSLSDMRPHRKLRCRASDPAHSKGSARKENELSRRRSAA
jgi:hypothetical protein